VLVKYSLLRRCGLQWEGQLRRLRADRAGFGNRRTGWTNGDFDGNGAVNFDDYVLIRCCLRHANGSAVALISASTILFGSGESRNPWFARLAALVRQSGQDFDTGFRRWLKNFVTPCRNLPSLAFPFP
jgi:hypothetical protein